MPDEGSWGQQQPVDDTHVLQGGTPSSPTRQDKQPSPLSCRLPASARHPGGTTQGPACRGPEGVGRQPAGTRQAMPGGETSRQVFSSSQRVTACHRGFMLLILLLLLRKRSQGGAGGPFPGRLFCPGPGCWVHTCFPTCTGPRGSLCTSPETWARSLLP